MVSAPTISRWIMIALNLSGVDTKIFTVHSAKLASSSKVNAVGNFETWVLVKRRGSRFSEICLGYTEGFKDTLKA